MLNIKETWKAIKGYEDRVEVSNTGKIRSIRTNHGKYQQKELKSFFSTTCQYPMVQITKNNVTRKYLIHRLVAEAFVDNPHSKKEVNHIDGNKLNNNAYNLEWVTRSENMKHAHETGLKEANRRIGHKSGISSKYHNVSWDKARNKWKVTIKDGGKPLYQKRFDNELDAAKAVDMALDNLSLFDRPRNFN